jgi:hypothetical protein
MLDRNNAQMLDRIIAGEQLFILGAKEELSHAPEPPVRSEFDGQSLGGGPVMPAVRRTHHGLSWPDHDSE